MNSSTTSSTSPTLASRVNCTSSTLARMVAVRSDSTSTWMSGGIHASRCGSSALMRSAVSITLAPATLLMYSRMAGVLPCHAASRTLATLSTTLATSDSRSAEPLTDLMTTVLYSLASVIWPFTAMPSAWRGPWKLPAASVTLALRMAVNTSCPARSGGAQRARVQLHPNGRLLRPVDLHLAHAVQLAQALRQDGVGRVVHLRRRQRGGGQRQRQDRRVGRVELAVVRPRRQVGRQVGGRGVDRRLHVVRRALDIAVDVELDHDRGRADRAGGGDLRHPRDLPQAPLQRRRDGGRHRLRIGAGPAGEHHDGGDVHRRQRRDRAGTGRRRRRPAAAPAPAAWSPPGAG